MESSISGSLSNCTIELTIASWRRPCFSVYDMLSCDDNDHSMPAMVSRRLELYPSNAYNFAICDAYNGSLTNYQLGDVRVMGYARAKSVKKLNIYGNMWI